MGLLGFAWTGLFKTAHAPACKCALPASVNFVPFRPTSPWDLPVAAVVLVLGVVLAVLIYRRRHRHA